MQKDYSPVRIKNPVHKHVLIRLLLGQKLNVIFDKEEFQDYKLDIVGQFLVVHDVQEIGKGWMATIAQETEKIDFTDNTLFLGGVNLFNSNHINSASLCVVSQNDNDDILRIVNPSTISCNLEANQLLDVVFHSNDFNLRWQAYPSGMNLCVEQLQYLVRQPKIYSGYLYEHFFRFRFNSTSVQYISEQPYGKYDGGHIMFTSNKNDKSIIKLTCSWRNKNSPYKALLVPKMPAVCNNSSIFKRFKKQAMHAKVEINKIDDQSLENGCNVVVSRI